MNNLERQNIDIIADIMEIVYDINKLDGSPIINIALNKQEFQMHTYEGNKCHMKIIDLNTNSSRIMRDLLFSESQSSSRPCIKRGWNLCDQ